MNKIGLEEKCWIEQLPDEVLSTIISFLTVKEATRTSILSKRWTNLYLFMSRLNFDCLEVFKFHEGDSILDQQEQYVKLGDQQEQYVKLVDQFMQHYTDSKIESFRLSFPFKSPFDDFADRCIKSAVKMGTEDLVLDLKDLHNDQIFIRLWNVHFDVYKFSFSIILSVSPAVPLKLKHLHLHNCSIEPVVCEPLVSLLTLELVDMAVDGTVLECIFLTCVNLRKLLLKRCEFLMSRSSISCSSMSLKFLQIIFPDSRTYSTLNKIEISGPELIYFEYSNMHHIPCTEKFFFSNVPKLEEIRLDLAAGYLTVDDMLSDIANDAPQLKRLCLPTRVDIELGPRIPITISKLSQIEELELIFGIWRHSSLLKMIPALVACPLLKKFHLTMNGQPFFEPNIPKMKDPPSKHPFPQLKEVKIGRFWSYPYEIEFVFYMLENAVSLEQMIVDTIFLSFHDRKFEHLSHEIPRQCIRGEVASSTAKLIIRHLSNERNNLAEVFMSMQNANANSAT